MTIPTTKKGEVVSINEADQFQPNETQFACGFYGVAMCTSLAQIEKAPTRSPQQIIADAEKWYAQFNGNNSISNLAGMTDEHLYSLLLQVGLHFQSSPTSIDYVRAWLQQGFPVILAIAETSVYDLDLQRNPYPWNPAGNHIIVATGLTSTGDVIVRDAANCTDLFNPNSLRPGPHRYRADMQLVSVTAVVPSWRARPPIGFDPTRATVSDLPTAQEDIVVIALSNPQVAQYFEQAGTFWKCKQTGKSIGNAILDWYRLVGNSALNGITYLGLPLSDEVGLGNGTVIQRFERGNAVYDPKHLHDNPPGSGAVYLSHIYDGIGVDPRLAPLQKQVADLTAKVNQQPNTQGQAELAQAKARLAQIEELAKI